MYVAVSPVSVKKEIAGDIHTAEETGSQDIDMKDSVQHYGTLYTIVAGK